MTSLHKLQSTWVVWYHNPSDINWDVKSYKNVYEINTIEDYAKKDIIPGGSKNNLEFLSNKICFSNEFKTYQKFILADSQTSGGLLISIPKEHSKNLLNELNKNSQFKSSIIGEFKNKEHFNIFCSH